MLREVCGSGAGEEEADAIPAGDLAAVPAREVGIDRSPAERAANVGKLRAAVDRGAGGVLRNGREGIVERFEPAAGPCGIGQRAADGAVQRPELRRGAL